MEELDNAISVVKVSEDSFGSIYQAFFHSARGGRNDTVKRLNQGSLQVKNKLLIRKLYFQKISPFLW